MDEYTRMQHNPYLALVVKELDETEGLDEKLRMQVLATEARSTSGTPVIIKTGNSHTKAHYTGQWDRTLDEMINEAD